MVTPWQVFDVKPHPSSPGAAWSDRSHCSILLSFQCTTPQGTFYLRLSRAIVFGALIRRRSSPVCSSKACEAAEVGHEGMDFTRGIPSFADGLRHRRGWRDDLTAHSSNAHSASSAFFT